MRGCCGRRLYRWFLTAPARLYHHAGKRSIDDFQIFVHIQHGYVAHLAGSATHSGSQLVGELDEAGVWFI